MYILAAFLSALAYSSDAIFGKLALEHMPSSVFIFILCCVYFIFGVVLFAWNKQLYFTYLSKKENSRTIVFALLAIIIGTVIADILMWKSIQLSNRAQLPITIAIIHSAPIFSIILVAIFFNKYLNLMSLFGLIIIMIGFYILIINNK
jgi:uncharacterized membrane protein